MGHAPTVTSAGYREMKKLRRFRRANSSPLWIGDPAVYAAIYSTNPSVNPFFPGPFEPGVCCFPMAPVGTAAELWAADLKQAQTTLQDVVRECDGTLRAAATGGRSQDGVGTAIAVTRGRIAQLRHLHSHLARGLSNLSTEPEAHGLTQREILHRAELLRQLEEDIRRAWSNFQSSLHPRRGLPDLESGSTLEEGGSQVATTAGSDGNMLSSERLVAQQDEHLDYLRGSVSNLKHIGTAINSEIEVCRSPDTLNPSASVEVHCKLLDEVHEATDHAHAKQKYAHSMLQHHMEHTSTTFLWGIIVFLFSVLIFVTARLTALGDRILECQTSDCQALVFGNHPPEESPTMLYGPRSSSHTPHRRPVVQESRYTKSVEDILAELSDRISTLLDRSSNPRLRELVEKYARVSPHLMRLATGGPASLENGILSLESKKAHVLNCSAELEELGKSLRLIQELQGVNLSETDATGLDLSSAQAQAELPAFMTRLNRVIARQEALEEDAREILQGIQNRDASTSV
ncbi:hypothetical protein FOZ60_004161 [Perkinsus olseni]|uniref:Uncharacterized protein n=1 Tax=Perkinsus olseni TaxID=32597 RepID=A0A7J6NU09_PEROL|nr:hypothetical protein FOZ60_004161 [Perkinsus olseni]